MIHEAWLQQEATEWQGVCTYLGPFNYISSALQRSSFTYSSINTQQACHKRQLRFSVLAKYKSACRTEPPNGLNQLYHSHPTQTQEVQQLNVFL